MSAPAPPELQSRQAIQAWGGILLAELVANGRGGLSPESQVYAGWAREDFAWFRRLEKTSPGLSSWNWDWVLGAALLWLDPGFGTPGGAGGADYTIVDWWRDLLSLQVGIEPNKASSYPLCRFFDGSETLSSVYGAMRYGAVAAVSLLATRWPQHPGSMKLVFLTRRYFEILATLLSLSSRPWTDPSYQGRNGFWYRGPTFAPVGERSDGATMYQNDQGGILETLRGGLLTSRRANDPSRVFAKLLPSPAPSEYFFSTFAREANSSPDSHLAIVLQDLAGVRLWAPTMWVRWPEGLLVYKETRKNSNTPCTYWAWLSDVDQQMTVGYPFPPGKDRGRGASGAPGLCTLTPNPWTIVAQGLDGAPDAKLILPVAGDPLWRIVGDGDGFREEKV